MPTKKPYLQDLTDEEILKEFVKRFQCDGAVLIYLDSKSEFGFGRWKTSLGKKWVNNIFNSVKNEGKSEQSKINVENKVKAYTLVEHI